MKLNVPIISETKTNSLTKLPRVVIIFTGGTIVSQYSAERGGFVPALTGTQFVETIFKRSHIARIEVEQFSNISSCNLTPDLWLKLSRRINELLTDPDLAGVVVTHGTDTLEETSYFLDLTITSDKPVVVVGAQRAASEPDSDGSRNLLDGVRVAVSPKAIGKGTLVVMNGQINAARDATKTSTVNVDTFKSLVFGALGIVDSQAVRFYRAPLRRQTISLDPTDRLGNIEIVLHYVGATGRIISSLLQDSDALDGLVVAATGLGHVSEAMYDAIAEVRSRDIPVVISTRVYTGRVMDLYANKGQGISLRELGCIFADNLSPQKARILLMMALTQTRSSEHLQQYFAY